MYELEYLYEQLKTKMNEETYLVTLNSVSESCYDICEAQREVDKTLKAIEEASNKNKFTKLDKLRGNFTKVDTILNKHKDAALKCKPIGLQYKDFKIFYSDGELKSRVDKAIKYLESFDVNKASEEALKKYIEDSNKNVQFNEVGKILGLNNPKYGLASYSVIKSTKDKEITKGDIADAIKFIENKDKVIKKVTDEVSKTHNEYVDWLRANNAIPTSKKDNDIEKLRRNALNHQKSLLNIARNSYLEIITQKYNTQLNQCKQIVVKAANYNPRNLKESYKIQDYIDAMYEFNKY